MASYTVVLRACPEAAREAVSQFLGRAFSLKDSTCHAISGSTPIILLGGLEPAEAAAMTVALNGLRRLGANLEISTAAADDLPKIDWPRRPQVFKRDLTDHVLDLKIPVSGGTVLELVQATLSGPQPTTSIAVRVVGPAPAPHVVPPATATHAAPAPAAAAVPPPPAGPSAQPAAAGSKQGEFRGIQLPEITPFSTPALPDTPAAAATPTPRPVTPAAGTPAPGGDALSRLNELFPEEESGGFLPNRQDITSILDKLLPDEEPPAGAPANAGSGRRTAQQAGGGWAVFLAKITDEARRTKAVDIIAQFAKVPKEEADALSKKMIIPVLKGAAKDEADACKAAFAKIGILARVKGPE